jgi:hypothetical protein
MIPFDQFEQKERIPSSRIPVSIPLSNASEFLISVESAVKRIRRTEKRTQCKHESDVVIVLFRHLCTQISLIRSGSEKSCSHRMEGEHRVFEQVPPREWTSADLIEQAIIVMSSRLGKLRIIKDFYGT